MAISIVGIFVLSFKKTSMTSIVERKEARAESKITDSGSQERKSILADVESQQMLLIKVLMSRPEDDKK